MKMEKVRLVEFPSDKKKGHFDHLFSEMEANQILRFHANLNNYEPTPLKKLNALAGHLGLAGICVKDESKRFGLKAFKGLGGSYAMARIIAEQLKIGIDQISKVSPNSFTFVTATDGNHGRGIAWAARNLAQKAVIYMPKGSSIERLENIRLLGAKAEITEWDYDETVRYAKKQAKKNDWLLVQDTAWEGYETIPLWIMQGYMTMGMEAVKQMSDLIPTHIFLQAGVGAMAGAMTGFFTNFYRERMPKIIIVEPNRADCLFQTALANDGGLHKAEGKLDSIMAGLCCGEVCTAGWEVLKHHADYFFSCPDYVAADGMRVLGNPLPGDETIISGESGAVTCGLIYNLLQDKRLNDLRDQIGLNRSSVVLCISTEGDTDRENYRHVVWDGWYRKTEG